MREREMGSDMVYKDMFCCGDLFRVIKIRLGLVFREIIIPTFLLCF